MQRTIWILLLMVVDMTASDLVMPCPDLVNPANMVIHQNKAYVSEAAGIIIYDLVNKKVVRHFGREGDGPQEFRIQANINNGGVYLTVGDDGLMANSLGKVSFYSLDGRYENEVKTFSRGSQFIGTHDGFFGIGVIQEDDGTEYYTMNLYSRTFGLRKELHRQEIWNDRKHLDPIRFTLLPLFTRQNEKLFISSTDPNGDILVFDEAGAALSKIVFPFPQMKVSESHRKMFEAHLNSDPAYKGFLEQYHGIIHYAKFFPVIRHLHGEGGRIFVITYIEEDNERICYLFDTKGNFIGQCTVNIPPISPFRLTPFYTQGDFFYVLFNNEKEDSWELRKTRIIF